LARGIGVAFLTMCVIIEFTDGFLPYVLFRMYLGCMPVSGVNPARSQRDAASAAGVGGSESTECGPGGAERILTVRRGAAARGFSCPPRATSGGRQGDLSRALTAGTAADIHRT